MFLKTDPTGPSSTTSQNLEQCLAAGKFWSSLGKKENGR
jgi:hypothetical protein